MMNNQWQQEESMEQQMQQDAALTQAAQEGEVTARQLGASVAADARREHEQLHGMEREAIESDIREGVAQLFEDGWTAQELAAFSQDPTAREAIAQGKSVARAACAYLRAQGGAMRKRGVPTARMAATIDREDADAIEAMTDEEFDAFSRRAQQAMMSGKRVRI